MSAQRATLAAVLWLLACGSGSPPQPPHVLLLTVDTLRPDYLSFNGYTPETSPDLDGLLRRSAYFDDALTPVPRTTPALASLLTGAYPHTTGVRTLTDALREGVVSLPERLRDAGYQTLAVVSNNVLGRERGLQRGFTVYDFGADGRSARQTVDAALVHLGRVLPGSPVFAWIHFVDPHVPYHPAPADAQALDPGYSGAHRLHFGWNRQPGEPADRHRAFPAELRKGEVTHRNALSDAVNAHIRRLYAADIRGLDREIGRLLEAVQTRLGGELLVVFTADHGESLGEHDLFFDHGDYVYGASARVPLAFALPEGHPLAGGRRCDGAVSLVDVVPTLLELLGMAPPEAPSPALEGRSLLPCLRGETLAPEPVFSESGFSFYPEWVPRRVRNDPEGRFRAVTRAGWRLVWTPFAAEHEAWELYDLRADPDETHNLYRADHPQVASLSAALTSWLARQPEAVPAKGIDPADQQALRALGYLE